MLALSELQRAMRRALLEDDERVLNTLDREIQAGDLSARERVAVYRNNTFGSLTDVLRETFPVVRRLVGDGFFAFAASRFIAAHPPSVPALSEYGAEFPEFLEAFPPCRELVYLGDTARFEWLMNVALCAADVAPVSASRLSESAPDDDARLVFRLHPACGYLASAWPIDRIWRANQLDAPDQSIDLEAGGMRLEVSRQDDRVVFRTLDEAEFAFRTSLAGGAPLGVALETALAVRSDFPAHEALAALFYFGLVVAVSSSSDAEHTS